MTVTQVRKGRTVTEVTVAGDTTEEEALELALTAARETRASLFGWHVGPLLEGDVRRVDLHTD